MLAESEDVMKLYKGIVKGRQRQLKTEGTGMWFSSSKTVAKTYSDEVETWVLDTSLPLRAARIDCHQKSWNEVNTDAYARKYKDYDVIIFKDIVDVGPLVLKYTKKGDKRTTKEAFKDFTADTIVVNNTSCLKKVQTEILAESENPHFKEDEEIIKDDWNRVLSKVESVNPELIGFLKTTPVHYKPDLGDCVAKFDINHVGPELFCLNVSEVYFELKPAIAIGVLLHELGHAIITIGYLLNNDIDSYYKYIGDNEGHNKEWWDLVEKLKNCFDPKLGVKVMEKLPGNDPSIFNENNKIEKGNSLKESTETLKQFNILYHGSKNGELRKDEKHKYNCLYVTPVFAYAAMYSTDSDSTHGCVFEMKPVRDLNIFDANDEGAIDQLKAKVEELNPENTLVRSIKWEDLKTKDWSTVCFRKDEIRDDLLLKAVKALGYDGYINTEWDEGCAEFYARGLGGCGKIVNTTSIGIFDENLLEIVDEKYFEDYSDDELFNECHQADEDLFITFLQDEGFDDYYYDNEEDAKKWVADNLLFLDVDEVNDLFEEYGSCYNDD